MFDKWLFKQIDNSALVVFRVLFGFLITLEAWGAIATGWIKQTLLEGDFTFNFIGFDFLQPLSGDGMYYYYGLMGLFGVFVMLGLKYRFSVLAYGVMWSAVYLMQKSSYNNHYYLLMLLLGIMACLPAHRYLSLDVKRNPKLKKRSMPRWVYVIIIAQLWIVYTYASAAKLYPDWLDASMAGQLMEARKNYWLVGDFLQQKWVHWCIAYFGILFDGLIIPALLFKPTRKLAFIVSIFFHLFNSFIFHIGIFPYMSLAFTLFFFPPETIQRIFLQGKKLYTENEIIRPKHYKPALVFFGIYFIIQISLPVRHWFIQDDVLWTEEGHRLSWRMMLRSKGGRISFKVVDKATGLELPFNYRKMLSRKQQRAVSTKPDVIWQFCQRVKKHYAAKGKDVAIYVDCKIRINGGDLHSLIDPKVDMATAKWDYFWHNEWLLPSPLNKEVKKAPYSKVSFE
ncbi:HTTM domain-containing protein [Leeuwenhoekiella marinoflava]|uniref:HTTM domain-containing protein n=1 Tax=Leeuwenhoekiella marinoflava TaxID=988 RepID=UPI0030025577